MIACSGYGPCADDEAYGWLTHVGSLRSQYVSVRPGRRLWRLVSWEKAWPRAFRGDKRTYRGVVVPVEAVGG